VLAALHCQHTFHTCDQARSRERKYENLIIPCKEGILRGAGGVQRLESLRGVGTGSYVKGGGGGGGRGGGGGGGGGGGKP
jgi:hypothetical protein